MGAVADLRLITTRNSEIFVTASAIIAVEQEGDNSCLLYMASGFRFHIKGAAQNIRTRVEQMAFRYRKRGPF